MAVSARLSDSKEYIYALVFFERGQKLCPIHWLKRSLESLTSRDKLGIQSLTLAVLLSPSFFAPAKLQRAAYPLILLQR
jgi:hypothetical protein